MIAHSLLQQLQDDGWGTVNTTLQLGTLPINATTGKATNGIALSLRGLPVWYANVEVQGLDFYVRNTNYITALQKAQELLEYIQTSYGDICTLPPLQGFGAVLASGSYKNVTITPVSSVSEIGVDDNGGMTYQVSAEIRYEKVN